MALSGTLTTNSYDGRYYKLTWTAIQSVENNTSTIEWEIEALGKSGQWYAQRNLKAVINGKTVCDKSARVEQYDGTVASGKTDPITHNSDGTKSVSMSLQVAVYTSSVNCKDSGTFTLNTIPRASTASMETGTLGSASTITISRASDKFTHTLQYFFGDKSGTLVEKTSSTTYSWTPSIEDFASQIPNSTSGKGTLRCITYNGSTKIGTKDTTITLNVPTSIVPTITSTSIEVDNGANSVIAEWGEYVIGYSKARIKAEAAGSYGSTISSFSISGGYTATQNGTELDYTGEIFSTSGDKTFNVIAKDSRGRNSSGVKAGTITVYSYTTPKITKFTVARSESNQNLIVVNANWTYSSVNGNNAAIATIFYKENSSNTWIEYGEITKGTSTTLDAEFSATSSFNFRLVVTDSLSGKAQSETFISTMEVLMDFRAGGKGLGIGKISEKNALEVALESFFTKAVEFAESVVFKLKATFEEQIQMKKGSYIHTASGTSGELGYIKIAQFVITETYRNSPITLDVVQRGDGKNKNSYTIKFHNVDSLDPELALFQHEGNMPAYLVKSAESTWDLYIKKAEKYDHVCVSNIEKSPYMKSVVITWGTTQVTDLPNGYIESTKIEPFTINSVAYEVTLSSNSYVSPYSYYGAFDISESDITNYGEPISITATGDAGAPIPVSLETSRKAYRVVSKSSVATVRIVYLKKT